MKNPLLYMFALAILLLTLAKADAQTIDSQKNNYLVLINNIEQLKPVMLTASKLAEEDGRKYGEFRVVICGKTVIDIPDNNSFAELLAKAKEQKVKVYACGLSLGKFRIDTEQLPGDLEVTENGILYSLQLKKKGFITLSI